MVIAYILCSINATTKGKTRDDEKEASSRSPSTI